jgi:hypothetical protein
MILNDFHTVCAWEKFPNKEAWKYDLMLSKKFTDMLTGEYLALMFKLGKCREVCVLPALKTSPPAFVFYLTSAIFCPQQFHEIRQNFCEPIVPFICIQNTTLDVFGLTG